MVLGKSGGANRPYSWKGALCLTLGLRVVYSLFAGAASLLQPANLRLMHSNALTENLSTNTNNFKFLVFGVWERFDTLWYLHVAAHGYDVPASVVFFPLYPALIRLMSVVLSPLAAALLIATVSSLFVFLGLQELLSEQMPLRVVNHSIVLCATWPASFILFAAYPDSLLLALIMWSWLMARSGRWGIALLLAFGAAITKAVGVAVLVPLLLIAFRHKKLVSLCCLLVAVGPISYIAYLHFSGRSSISAAYSQYWQTSTKLPGSTLWVAVVHLLRSPSPLLLLNLSILTCVCLLSIFARLGIEYRLYAGCVIFLLLCKETVPPLQSMMRYVLIIFPAFPGAAYKLQSLELRSRFGLICAFLFLLNLGLLWLFVGWSLVV